MTGQILILLVFVARLTVSLPLAAAVRRDAADTLERDARVDRWLVSTWWTVPAFALFAPAAAAVALAGLVQGSGEGFAWGPLLFTVIAVICAVLTWVERAARNEYLRAHPEFARFTRLHVIDPGGRPRLRALPIAVLATAAAAVAVALVAAVLAPASGASVGVAIAAGVSALACGVGSVVRHRQSRRWASEQRSGRASEGPRESNETASEATGIGGADETDREAP